MLNGFINLNKSKGMTSQQAVFKIKKILQAEGLAYNKIGHMGTLDPDGEGVLPIALGRATRLFNYFLDKQKVYYTEFEFGTTTDTLDSSGEIIEKSPIIPTLAEIKTVIPMLTGRVSQVPPIYSAKMINGERAYKLARKGKQIALKPKDVNIFSIELIEQIADNVFSFKIACGGGTYIRSIARDMALATNTVGLMRYIKRLQSGSFCIENSQTLTEIASGINLISISEICQDFPRYDAPINAKKLILDGVKITLDDMPSGFFTLYLENKLIGIATKTADNRLVIKTRLI